MGVSAPEPFWKILRLPPRWRSVRFRLPQKDHRRAIVRWSLSLTAPCVFRSSLLIPVRDIFLPNGNHNKDRFEVISYVTNSCHRESGTAWSSPPGTLPRSETEGSTQLEPFGRAFANVPPKRSDYVSRPDLEGRLNDELLTPDRHPIVSLTGPGGIGKTSVAIAALHAIKDLDHLPYEAILWISARDVDLLESGPKPVSPRVVTQENIAHAAVDLFSPTRSIPPISRDALPAAPSAKRCSSWTISKQSRARPTFLVGLTPT